MKVDKRILAMGAGAGVGAIISPVLKKWVEPHTGAHIPYLDSLQNWGTYHVFIPLVSGALLVALTQFTNKIRNQMTNDVLAMYGFAALFSGIITGITETTGFRAPMRARAPAMMSRPPVSRPVARMQTPTGIASGQTIVS